ncbi:MAG: hypothetical protein P794_09510 [Epsilonproteobacteria bacterium (ex Lamellibrachia satsuma)]|nr:MAG: hypothetical protein P794_09510 [Epsilonproteobacteria bacterium (ex Lamellibrachia satsuma)]
MANTGEKLPNGEAVREFYSSLDMIEDYYWNKGYRKKAYLYRTLKEKLGWRMSLESFKYHFKRAIESNANSKPQNAASERSSAPVTEVIQEEYKAQTPKEETSAPSPATKGPKIVDSNFGQVKKIKKNTRAERESIG